MLIAQPLPEHPDIKPRESGPSVLKMTDQRADIPQVRANRVRRQIPFHPQMPLELRQEPFDRNKPFDRNLHRTPSPQLTTTIPLNPQHVQRSD
ncbi:hypothetical protein Aph01nite_58560 [Acrocarpospora phusangensis]|uniref:Uncharacterized protein n=1 Tax=Acrocarpospora phusangensis TaxID=1070424 RepID=A0A919QGN5_9ACTN|nr:hypothetical protein Aph01nite_58560 [Acrocarpospora phusangensis]